jgi:hypothetical protein
LSLSESQLAQYLDEGYLLVDDLIPPAAFDLLIAEIEANIDFKARELAAQGKLGDLCAGMPFGERLTHLCAAVDDAEARVELWHIGHGKHHKTAGMFAVWTHPALVDAAEQVLGPEILAHPQYNLRAKLPNQLETVVPWHQDLGYLQRDADETFMLNFWIPLVNAPMETGAMQVIPGSHRWEVLPHEKVDGYDGVREENLPAHEVVDCPLPLGGALLIQSRSMHRSVPNTSGAIRWSLDLRYCDSRKPTGRESVPGFVVRSEAAPERVTRDWRDWVALFAADA